jgi:hypothetical protein
MTGKQILPYLMTTLSTRERCQTGFNTQSKQPDLERTRG